MPIRRVAVECSLLFLNLLDNPPFSRITPLGRLLAQIPVEVNIGKMLVGLFTLLFRVIAPFLIELDSFCLAACIFVSVLAVQVLGALLGVTDQVCTVAAALSVQSPFGKRNQKQVLCIYVGLSCGVTLAYCSMATVLWICLLYFSRRVRAHLIPSAASCRH